MTCRKGGNFLNIKTEILDEELRPNFSFKSEDIYQLLGPSSNPDKYKKKYLAIQL